MECGERNADDIASRLEQALVEYMRAVDAGEPVDREEFLRRHAEVEHELRRHFADIDALDDFVEHDSQQPGGSSTTRASISPDSDQAKQATKKLPGTGEKPGMSLPRRIAKFELTEMLGQGAFGTVYRAKDTELGREVAVKTPRTGSLISAEEEERFLGEGKSAAKLRHPGIVPVYEVGRSDGMLYIAAEYVDGITLNELLKEWHFSSQEAAEVTFLIALALNHAHKNGVVHRDLKPANIMMELFEAEGDPFVGYDSGFIVGNSSWHSRSSSDAPPTERPAFRPRLMDFGLAHRTDNDISLTVEGQILGTPVYMSPEQARGEAHTVDGRSDVYSLGVILYQLLTGELPFRGSARMVLLQVLNDDPRPPRQLDESIPRDLETITLRCLEKEPSKRYATSADVAAELRRFLDGIPVLARPVSRGERVWKWCRRNPMISGAAMVTFLALTFGLAASLIGYVQVSRALDKKNIAEFEAQQSLRDARRVVNDFFLTVANKDLLNRPGMQPVQLQLLLRATEYFDKFRDRTNATLDVRLEGAESLYRFADLAHALGKSEEARQALNTSVDILKQIASSHPEDPEALRRLGEAHTCLGNFHEAEGELDEGDRAYEEAINARDRLRSLQPNEVEPSRQLANAWMNRALARKDRAAELGDAAAAGALLSSASRDMMEAQQIRNRFVQSEKASAQLRFDIAQGYYNLAMVKDAEINLPAVTNVEDVAAAKEERESLMEQAIAIFETLLGEESTELNLITTEYNLLICRRTIANWRVQDKETTDFSSIVEAFTRLARENPDVAVYRRELAQTHINAALATAGEDCMTHLEVAKSILTRLAEENDKEHVYQEMLDLVHELIDFCDRARHEGQQNSPGSG